MDKYVPCCSRGFYGCQASVQNQWTPIMINSLFVSSQSKTKSSVLILLIHAFSYGGTGALKCVGGQLS